MTLVPGSSGLTDTGSIASIVEHTMAQQGAQLQTQTLELVDCALTCVYGGDCEPSRKLASMSLKLPPLQAWSSCGASGRRSRLSAANSRQSGRDSRATWQPSSNG